MECYLTQKTKVMFISTRQKRIRLDVSILSLSYNEVDLQLTTCDKILGVYIDIDENFQWDNHFKYVCKKFHFTFGSCLKLIISHTSTQISILQRVHTTTI